MSKDFNNPRSMPLHRQRGVATAEVTVSCYYLNYELADDGWQQQSATYAWTGRTLKIEDLTE